MNIEQENFAVELTSATKSHEDWLAVVRFGLGTLLTNQGLLGEIIVNEAAREAAKVPTHKASDEVAKILRELGLKLTL